MTILKEGRLIFVCCIGCCVLCLVIYVGLTLYPLLPLNYTYMHEKRHSPKNIGSFNISDTGIQSNSEGRDVPSFSHVLYTVKSSSKSHKSRLHYGSRTWMTLAKPENVFVVTDRWDPEIVSNLGGQLIVAACGSTHSREDLSCKMSVEFDIYMKSEKPWWCHVDDDTYVVVPHLEARLLNFDPMLEWYLGKASTSYPIIVDYLGRDKLPVSFWFATGGGGFCVSRALAVRMTPYVGGGNLVGISDMIRLPDDCAFGYIVYCILGGSLTTIKEFHSHLERIISLSSEEWHTVLTLGSTVSITNVSTNHLHDPLRFFAIHCFLFSNADICSSTVNSSHHLGVS